MILNASKDIIVDKAMIKDIQLVALQQLREQYIFQTDFMKYK
jgi:hypothetical protein